MCRRAFPHPPPPPSSPPLEQIRSDLAKTIVEGAGRNWVVCITAFVCMRARIMAGKLVGFWFSISAFVAIGSEHFPANMLMLLLGLLVVATVAVGEMLYKNWPSWHLTAWQGTCSSPLSRRIRGSIKRSSSPRKPGGLECALVELVHIAAYFSFSFHLYSGVAPWGWSLRHGMQGGTWPIGHAPRGSVGHAAPSIPARAYMFNS